MILKVGTDCSGVGAPEVALRQLPVEIEHIFACEKDKYARTTFMANHHPATMYNLMEERDNKTVPQLDLYVAGYPCQAFCHAGERGGESDARGTVFYTGREFIKQNRPRVFILENVTGMLNVKGVNILEKWLDLLAKTVNGQSTMFPNPDNLGYNCYWKILNTLDYGIPQNRERVFIVGLREDTDDFRFPKPVPLSKTVKNILEPTVADKYYLSETMLKWLKSHSIKNAEKGHGCNFTPLTENSYAKTVNARYFKMGVDDNYLLEADGRIRRFTPRECFRLQNFPDSFIIDKVSETQAYKQAGNSMTVAVIKAIIQNVLEGLK